jgi:HlyD family secretion protein
MQKKWIIIIVIAVVILVSGGLLLRGQFAKATKEDASNAPEIKTATVERGNIEVTIDATGTIEPLNIVEVSSKASGKILEITVEEGDYVEQDDVLARIETTYVEADLEQAKADFSASQARFDQSEINIVLQKEQTAIQIQQAREKLAEAEKQLEQLKEQIRIEEITNLRQLNDAKNSHEMAKLRHQLLTSDTVREEDKKRAQASVNQAKANRDLAKKEYDRKQQLFDKQFISKSDLDAAATQHESAKAQYDSALQQLELVKQPASPEELELSQAEIKRAAYAIDAANEQIEKEKYRKLEIKIQEHRVTQAKDALNLALANEKQIELKEKDLESSTAQLMRSQSALKLAQESYEDTVIRAPISGTILEKRVEEGQVIVSSFSGGGGRGGSVSSEGQVLVTMADLEKVYVATEVDETDIGKVKVGQSVTITVEAYPDQPLPGEVLRIAPQGQVVQNVTTFKVITEITNPRPRGRGRWGRGGGFTDRGGDGGFRRGGGGGEFTQEQRERFRQMRQQRQEETAASDNTETSNENAVAAEPAEAPDPWMAMADNFFDGQGGGNWNREETPSEDTDTPFLKPGMNATVEIAATNKRNILVLPNEAILSFGNRKMVRVVGEDGQPGRPQPIEAGVSSFDRTEIISGLNEGQAVAVGGFERRGGGDMERFRRMMGNPASTMRRMQRSAGGGGGRGGR